MNQNQDKTEFTRSSPHPRPRHNSDTHVEVSELTGLPIDSGNPYPLELEDVDDDSPSGNNTAIRSAETDELLGRIQAPHGQSTRVSEVQIPSIQTDHVDFAANEYPATYEVGSDTSSEGLLGSGETSPFIPAQDKPSDRELLSPFPELGDPLVEPRSPHSAYRALIPPGAVGLDDSLPAAGTSNLHLRVPRRSTERRKAHGPYSPGSSRSSSHSRSNSGSGSEGSTVGSYIARRRRPRRRESRHLREGSVGGELMTVGALGETLPAFKTITLSIQFCPVFNVDPIQETVTFAQYKYCLKTVSNIAADEDLYTSALEVTRQICNQHQRTADVNRLSVDEHRASQELVLSRFRAWRRAERVPHDESSTHGAAYSPASVTDAQATQSFLHKMAKYEQEVVDMVGGRLRDSGHWDDTEIIVTRNDPIYLFRDQTEAESVIASIRGIDLKGIAFDLAPNEVGDLNLDYPIVAQESGSDPQRRGSVPLFWSSVASSEGVDPQLLMARPDALDQWAHEPTQI